MKHASNISAIATAPAVLEQSKFKTKNKDNL